MDAQQGTMKRVDALQVGDETPWYEVVSAPEPNEDSSLWRYRARYHGTRITGTCTGQPDGLVPVRTRVPR